MARQKGILPLSGKLGDKIYYFRRDKNGKVNYFVRQAPDEVKQTVATKRAASDFGTASRCAKVMRHALKEYTQSYDSGALINSLNKVMGAVVRADNSHQPGNRRILAQHMHLLEGFSFNHATNIERLLGAMPVIAREDNCVTVSLPEIIFSRRRAFNGITHLSIRAIALSVDFTRHRCQQMASEAVIIPRDERRGLSFTLNTGSGDITCILLQVQAYYEVNGALHLSRNSECTALDIVSVALPVRPVKKKKREKKLYNNLSAFWSIPVVQIVPQRRRGHLAIADLPPGLRTPRIAVPGVETPRIAAPGVETPRIAVPGVETPRYKQGDS
ncbi:hypothetical protein [Chitinophaga ginsengisoli]|uniref:Uncharacterized protein n=1 Tax=Chitinophaga ginsengisoli TaxID=363837 RepID=A0A2P8GL74_9BACT|nr:hypothetical protein [Chitinophaga ginsengisoli]PSL34706.1 hypothetical protein CLV42_102279 [Chitinophaga ginsengisoli]